VKRFKDKGSVSQNASQVNKIINETIKSFVNEEFKEGIQGLEELGSLYKKAGTAASTFAELAQFIENEAIERSGNPLLQTQIRSALQDRKKNRPILMVVK